jgi:TPR repeat protein
LATIGITLVSTGCSSLRTKADAGDPVAQYQLAKEIYASSPEESLALLRKASSAGNSDAQYELGAYYLNLGSEKSSIEKLAQNERLAIEQFLKSAEQGNAEAQLALYMMYVNPGYSHDAAEPAKAILWLSKAAEHGHNNAEMFLGQELLDGHSSPKNYPEALKWFKKAASGGHSAAYFYIGKIYWEGLGVPANRVEAIRYYRTGAEANDEDSMRKLGDLYAKGLGVQKSDEESRHWYRKADARKQLRLMEIKEFERKTKK